MGGIPLPDGQFGTCAYCEGAGVVTGDPMDHLTDDEKARAAELADVFLSVRVLVPMVDAIARGVAEGYLPANTVDEIRAKDLIPSIFLSKWAARGWSIPFDDNQIREWTKQKFLQGRGIPFLKGAFF